MKDKLKSWSDQFSILLLTTENFSRKRKGGFCTISKLSLKHCSPKLLSDILCALQGTAYSDHDLELKLKKEAERLKEQNEYLNKERQQYLEAAHKLDYEVRMYHPKDAFSSSSCITVTE